MAEKADLNETMLIEMYKTGETIPVMEKVFGVSHGVIYRILKENDININRKKFVPWTIEEDYEMFKGIEANCTGREWTERIPTRTFVAIKGHLINFRRQV